METDSHLGAKYYVMAKKSTETNFKYNMALNWIFSQKTKNVSWGQNARSNIILKPMAFGSRFRGQMLNIMAL
jgi:hypothetical protein